MNHPTTHRRGCAGHCEYCNYFKKLALERKKKKEEIKFCWDEVSVII